MTLSEKIKNSKNIARFMLYKEGLFFKCYNEDAMVFSKFVKPYKVNSKFVKSIKAEVQSLGFPISEVEKGNLSFEMISANIGAVKFDTDPQSITFYLEQDVKQGFETWSKSVGSEKSFANDPETEIKKGLSGQENHMEVISLIKQFDLANSTPIEALNFIQQLKKEVQKMDGRNGNI